MTRGQAQLGLNSILCAMDQKLDLKHRMTLLENGFEMLGMLKLEEPKSPFLLAREIINARIAETGAKFSWLEADTIMARLDAAGLHIVEK